MSHGSPFEVELDAKNEQRETVLLFERAALA
jgi:hypothetical protein